MEEEKKCDCGSGKDEKDCCKKDEGHKCEGESCDHESHKTKEE
ncbi:MAG: hypothetical protein WC264_02130 [Candidatus Paceibacterota bacterium]|jgi:hypothetical protein